MKKKPNVWYVDDLPENLADFKAKHGKVFAIETFSDPEQVLQRLADSTPDALLCDVFFYDTAEIAARMEARVQERAKEIREFGKEIGANDPKNQAGIRLIQIASQRLPKGFPVYAYTSKGPYLLDELGFETIAETGAKWLFKRKYRPLTEQYIISQDIEEFRLTNSFTRRAAHYFWLSLFTSGVLGGVIVWLLTEQLPKLWR